MSKKSRDKHVRWRNKMVSFRASNEESKSIDEAVALSGLTKQEYIITKLLNRDVVVVGNPRVFKMLKIKIDDIYKELIRISEAGDVSVQLIESINLVANIYSGMINDNEGN
jgi:uncharacterized protein (DUF1778 family)